MSKICIKCDIEKEINSDNFSKDKKCSDGYRNVCRECCNSRNRHLFKIGSLSVDKKKERMRQYMKKKRKDPEFSKSERKRERERHKERIKTDPEYRKKVNKRERDRRNNDPEYRKKVNKRQRERHKERIKTDPEYKKKVNKKYYERKKEKMENDPEYRKKVNNGISKRKKERMNTDPVYRFKVKIQKRIRSILKDRGYTKKSKTFKILGCSFEDFKGHIESHWEDWMNWDNYGLYNGEEKYGWDLDHIVPLSSAECEGDIYRLNHYSNIQPLCSYVNRDVKRDIIDWKS